MCEKYPNAGYPVGGYPRGGCAREDYPNADYESRDYPTDQYAHVVDKNSKESSSVYERLYPLRFPLMAIGGIIFLIGLGMCIGGFAGLIADMDVKIRRTGAPNIGYLLMLIVSIVVMVGGGISLFCGCGTIRYHKRKNDPEYKKKKYIADAAKAKTQMINGKSESRSAPSFSSAQMKTLEPNGDVTYTVTYQYRGPPPAEINGIAAYPAPPPDVPPTLKIDQSIKMIDQKSHTKSQLRAKHTQPTAQRVEDTLSLANVPRKLVLIKRL